MSQIEIDKLDIKSNIIIKGASLHNLKGVNVAIPRNKFTVITGLSGSGKSTLAFETLYAEGRRRYVESLSSYARQFLGKIDKPQVDDIKGISPAIAIEQKVNSTNPRSTVGTTTEIYEYLKLLFFRIGKTYSPLSKNEVKKHSVSDVINHITKQKKNTKLLLLSPIKILKDRTIYETLQILARQGYARINCKKGILKINALDTTFEEPFELVISRLSVSEDESFVNRLSESINICFYEGKGECVVEDHNTGERLSFSDKFNLDGMTFLEPTLHLFSFNNPYGACLNCEGYGSSIDIDESLVIPNKSLSIYDNALACWRGESTKRHKEKLVDQAYKFDFPIHKPWSELSDSQKEIIWKGNKFFLGLNDFFSKLESKSYKIQNRVILSRYKGKTLCKVCHGKRLRRESNYVKIANKSISNLVDLPLNELSLFFKKLKLKDYEYAIAKRLIKEISTRLDFLINLGLEYLTLNRNSNTLSGGESQRINLATSLGSSLVGSMYILDEPSVGLHSRDSKRLVKILKSLRDLGNTVIVVEHDEDIIKEADTIIDMGPEAGVQGGEIVAQGSLKQIKEKNSLTSKYLSGKLTVETPQKRRSFKKYIKIIGAEKHNLKKVDALFPLDSLTVVSGVSGSGKSTLVNKILYPALQRCINGYGKMPNITNIEGDINHINSLEYISQNPIGKSSRSNPVTYIKAYNDIRQLFADQRGSKINNFSAKHFSFNVVGGRCETCKGDGEVTIEMQFMADVHLLCDTCNGKRFKNEVLNVTFQGKNINEVLNMSVYEAILFFNQHHQESIVNKLQPLQDIGMGYVALGQPSSTLSGGEAQRIKLASFLSKGHQKDRKLFIFDEPTTGLHFHDVKKLISAFNSLITNGHSVIVIEHNIDLIKSADYVIDMGPDGGQKGGYIVVQGTPEEVASVPKSVTGQFLRKKL